MEIEDVVRALRSDRSRIPDPADVEALAGGLSFGEIAHSVVHAGILEDCPDDKPYPSCLIYGDTGSGDPVHSAWAYNQGSAFAVLIATYRPYPNRWIKWRTRRVK